MFILFLVLDFIAPTTAGTTTGLAFSKVPNITSITIPWTNTPATIKYTPARPAAVLTTATFSAAAYNFASSTTATKAIQVYANTTVAITLSEALDNPLLLYCSNWPPGTYTFMNAAFFKSKNIAATIKPDGTKAIFTIPRGGGNFNGILQFPLTASRTLRWLPEPNSQTIKLIFAVGQLILCTKPIGVDSSLVAGTCGGIYNSVCTYKCKEGFLAHTYTSAKCTVSGTYVFSSLPAPCTAIKCAAPATVDSSLQQQNTCGGSYNSVCAYACKSGYNAGTFTSQKCNVSGNYVFSPPLKPCLAQCSAPTVDPVTTTIGTCPSGLSNSGSICTLACTTGYEVFTGTLSTKCTNGTWSTPSGSCVAITCSPLATVDPSLTRQSGTCDGSYNSICNYTCNTFYSGREPQMSQRCTVNGTYEFSTPLQPCLAQCRTRPTWAPPQYQFPASNWSVYAVDSGYKGTYVCNAGAAPSTPWSTFISTCTNGTWSNTTGICTPITCTVPADLASRNITVANRCGGSYNSLCDVKCTSPGFNNQKSYTSQSCSVSGEYQWASPIVCEPITCEHTFDSSWIATPGTCDGSWQSTCYLTCAANYVPEQFNTTTSVCTGGYYSFQYVSGTYRDINPSSDPCRLSTKIYFSNRNTYLIESFPTPPFNTTQGTSVVAADNYCDITSCTFFTQLRLSTGAQLFSFYNVPLGTGNTYTNNSGWVYTS